MPFIPVILPLGSFKEINREVNRYLYAEMFITPLFIIAEVEIHSVTTQQ